MQNPGDPTNPARAVVLVSFEPHDWHKDVARSLAMLGYQIRKLDSRAWLERSHAFTDWALVLLFEAADIHHQAVRDAITRTARPCLAVLVNGESNSGFDVLRTCDEFVYWPCVESELHVRLTRLFPWRPLRPSTAGHLDEPSYLSSMVGQSPAFLEALRRVRKIASGDAPTLIGGETGTGKELAARAIHHNSPRRDQPFIAVNCGAIPDNLVENEFFGHERGAFTDARASYIGLIGQANKGTLFLDEIEALSPKGQVSLLRFLENREYRPLGSKRAIAANVRLIAASNADLFALGQQGEYRQDLYYRLNIMSVTLPPLRERHGDVQLLADHFLKIYGAQYGRMRKVLDGETLNSLSQHNWPGNIRELEHLMHRAVVLDDSAVLHLPDGPVARASPAPGNGHVEDSSPWLSLREAKARAIKDLEERYLKRLMSESSGNVTLAARRAGKERRALGKLLKKHSIDRSVFIK